MLRKPSLGRVCPPLASLGNKVGEADLTAQVFQQLLGSGPRSSSVKRRTVVSSSSSSSSPVQTPLVVRALTPLVLQEATTPSGRIHKRRLKELIVRSIETGSSDGEEDQIPSSVLGSVVLIQFPDLWTLPEKVEFLRQARRKQRFDWCQDVIRSLIGPATLGRNLQDSPGLPVLVIAEILFTLNQLVAAKRNEEEQRQEEGTQRSRGNFPCDLLRLVVQSLLRTVRKEAVPLELLASTCDSILPLALGADARANLRLLNLLEAEGLVTVRIHARFIVNLGEVVHRKDIVPVTVVRKVKEVLPQILEQISLPEAQEALAVLPSILAACREWALLVEVAPHLGERHAVSLALGYTQLSRPLEALHVLQRRVAPSGEIAGSSNLTDVLIATAISIGNSSANLAELVEATALLDSLILRLEGEWSKRGVAPILAPTPAASTRRKRDLPKPEKFPRSQILTHVLIGALKKQADYRKSGRGQQLLVLDDVSKAVEDKVVTLHQDAYPYLKLGNKNSESPGERKDHTTSWSCHFCLDENSGWESAFTCRNCDAPRTPWSLCTTCFHVSKAATGPCVVCRTSSGQRRALVRDWSCTFCETRNPEQCFFSCSACSRSRTAGMPQKHPFTCSSCKATHRTPFCEPCGKLLLPEVGVKATTAGDEIEEAEEEDSNPYAWKCGLCLQWHGWFDTCCPTCPTVPRWGAAATRRWRTITCDGCGGIETDSRKSNCATCGSHFDYDRGSLLHCRCGQPLPTNAAWCASCNNVTKKGRTQGGWCCRKCGELNVGDSVVAGDPGEGGCSRCGGGSIKFHFPLEGVRCGLCAQAHSPIHPTLACRLTEGCGGVVSVGAASLATGADLVLHRFMEALQVLKADRGMLLAGLQAVNSALEQSKPGRSNQFGLTRSQLKATSEFIVEVAATQDLTQSRADRAILLLLASVEKGLLGTTHVSVGLGGRCRHCLGTHPEALCVAVKNTWVCSDCQCEVVGDTSERRLCCPSCLSLREEFMEVDDNWTELWQCGGCSGANPTFDDTCAQCGQVAVKEEDREDIIPCCPAKCGICNEAHLQALCPRCTGANPLPLKKHSVVRGFVVGKGDPRTDAERDRLLANPKKAPVDALYIQPWGVMQSVLRVDAKDLLRDARGEVQPGDAVAFVCNTTL